MAFRFKERYIDLLTDFGFKRVFGTDANKQFTIDFLNTLLPERHHIQALSFKKNENLGLTPLDRRAIFDVFCEGANIELPKFKKTLDQLDSQEDKWLFLFRHLPELGEKPQPLVEPIFDDLFEVAEITNFSDDEQDIYQATLKAYRDFQNVVSTAIQEAEEKAEKQGIERGAERERSLILRQLTRRVGPLPNDILSPLQQLSLDELERLANALLDFNHMDDLRRWLDEHLSG